jgi:hypothetical protein
MIPPQAVGHPPFESCVDIGYEEHTPALRLCTVKAHVGFLRPVRCRAPCVGTPTYERLRRPFDRLRVTYYSRLVNECELRSKIAGGSRWSIDFPVRHASTPLSMTVGVLCVTVGVLSMTVGRSA